MKKMLTNAFGGALMICVLVGAQALGDYLAGEPRIEVQCATTEPGVEMRLGKDQQGRTVCMRFDGTRLAETRTGAE